MVATFALLFIVSGIFSEIFSAGRKEAFLSEMFIIIPALVFVYRKGYPVKEIFRLNKVNTKIILYSILIGISFIILSALMMILEPLMKL